MSVPHPEFGPEDFAARCDVSRETLARLKAYVGVLRDWNARHNLVSARSLDDVWRRHVWDSAQLSAYVPASAVSLVDLGSGAGFPGIVLALMLQEKRPVRVVLFESILKKSAFLTAAAERSGAQVEVRNTRMEAASKEAFDVVTARACAPLPKLLGYAQNFWGRGTKGLFLKGQSLEAELTEAHKSWTIEAVRHPSVSDASGVVLEVRHFARAANVRS